MKKWMRWFGIGCLLGVLLLGISYGMFRYGLTHYGDDLYQDSVIQDVGRLMPTKVRRVVQGKEEEQLVSIIKEANEKGWKISVAGMRHSQGGHTYYRDGVVLDMTTYNRVLEIDPERKTIQVQSGTTWDDIQRAVAPYGLAVKVMQSQNIFTVGGAISVNVHGRDIRNDSLHTSVNWFRLLLPDGSIKKVDRTSEPELYRHVIGGYGLFGVILDVELQLTDDAWYTIHTRRIPFTEFEEYVQTLRNRKEVKMAYARISTAPSTYLNEMYAVEYHETKGTLPHTVLKTDQGAWITYSLLNMSRHSSWGKDLFWTLQRRYIPSLNGSMITRNNAMRSESDFLLYKSASSTDVLQEYFIPIDEFQEYIEDLRRQGQPNSVNLMNFTLRYVSQDHVPALSYAKEDSIAFVGLFNHAKTKQGIQEATADFQQFIDTTLRHRGTFYLPYYPYATEEQLLASYPSFSSFVETKKRYDPEERFMNEFYRVYRNAK